MKKLNYIVLLFLGINDLSKPGRIIISEEDNNTIPTSDEDNTHLKSCPYISQLPSIMNITAEEETCLSTLQLCDNTDLKQCGNESIDESMEYDTTVLKTAYMETTDENETNHS